MGKNNLRIDRNWRTAYNSVFAVRFVHPNAFGTSQTRKTTLSEINLRTKATFLKIMTAKALNWSSRTYHHLSSDDYFPGCGSGD